MTEQTKPSIGCIVVYRSKIDNGPGNDVLAPAIITRTVDSTVKPVIERWGPEPSHVTDDDGKNYPIPPRPADVVDELESEEHVDLTVFGVGQTYREFNISRGDERGQWNWPQIVRTS